MEKSSVNKVGCKVAAILQWIAAVAPLSLVAVSHSTLPAGETVGQWVWFDKMAIASSVCILLSLLPFSKKPAVPFCGAVSWALIAFGGIEAVWGLRQLYGFTASGHSLYALTGSFFNPGPYSGYLAMVLPVCLHQWLVCRKREGMLRQAQHGRYSWGMITWKANYITASGTMLLTLCVLPAGMSRSAWVAAGVSCLWVYGCHVKWNRYISDMWWLHKERVIGVVVGTLCFLVLAGYLVFSLKPDSAKGRLFMWKMTCYAIAEEPLLGHGAGNFVAAYGDAQEAYFAAGDYEPWEEHVAGSPEYAFNEYLQVAVERGIPLALCLPAVIIVCLYAGIRKERYGICGAIFSLMIFSFSSYPLQLPVFVVTSIILLLACVLDNRSWQWLGLAVVAGVTGGIRLKNDLRMEQACRDWMNARVIYNVGAYESAEKDYERLYPILKDRAAFLFEYGHGLHKQQKFETSDRILKEALKQSCDPMILNILGKNSQQSGDYWAAEEWYIRSTRRLPGRIYPYYLLAKLYAEPGFRNPEKLEEMKRIVLTKEPKVNSTAIREMREEVKKLECSTSF